MTIVPGSGIVAEESRAVGDFTRVEFATIGRLHVVQGADESLLVRAEHNLLPYLVSELRGDLLVMRTASGVDLAQTLPIDFFLTVVDLTEFTFSGVGGADLQGLVAADLSARSTGVGPVTFVGLVADTLAVSLSGIGDVSVAGQVDEQSVTVSGWGDYEAAALASRVSIVVLTAAGSATVAVTERLTATILSIGSVYYVGDPVVESTISGSGSIVKIG